jgi:cell division protease FtsH
MVFHDPTTGAGNDIEKATALARAMVTQYGMTERLGAVKLGESDGEPFMGRDFGHTKNYSEEVAAIVDEEIKAFIAVAHQEAFDILVENRDVLDALVLELMEKETLDKAEVATIFEALRRRPIRPAWTGSDTRIPSSIPPVEFVKKAVPPMEDEPVPGVAVPPPFNGTYGQQEPAPGLAPEPAPEHAPEHAPQDRTEGGA